MVKKAGKKCFLLEFLKPLRKNDYLVIPEEIANKFISKLVEKTKSGDLAENLSSLATIDQSIEQALRHSPAVQHPQFGVAKEIWAMRKVQSDLGHRNVAAALAEAGFIAAAPLHPRNNYRDNSGELRRIVMEGRPLQLKAETPTVP